MTHLYRYQSTITMETVWHEGWHGSDQSLRNMNCPIQLSGIVISEPINYLLYAACLKNLIDVVET